jgi:hypothetical protein
MTLTERLNPDRRTTDVEPIAERRDGSERREPFVPRWLTWTKQNDSRGKSLDGRAA